MRRVLLGVCLFVILALPAFGQGDKAKPNTLTPKEIADGWILLFDGETTFGWTVALAEAQGKLQAANGVLDLGGLGLANVATTTAFTEFELAFEYNTIRAADKNVVGSVSVQVAPETGTKGIVYTLPAKPGWSSGTIRVADGILQWSANTAKLPWKERAFITLGQNEGSAVQFRNIKLRPLNTVSLFNGKDLTGWKEFPGKKSKFAIVDGAINVKDGPGDLQTVGKYKDFVLQLDCISNGKHLNSGIFFRCRDNEYQNGYEAQIRNEFKAEPQKYLVEEYDPKTNKLIGKKEVLSNAFDFGTGAIYRRQPARKQMSKDGEWFTMTIAAHGNHLATWVNGVQVTDWYDHRPKSDNARTGQKLDAGHISIQGHDPTTDLSFKNFRIAEFK